MDILYLAVSRISRMIRSSNFNETKCLKKCPNLEDNYSRFYDD